MAIAPTLHEKHWTNLDHRRNPTSLTFTPEMLRIVAWLTLASALLWLIVALQRPAGIVDLYDGLCQTMPRMFLG